MTSSLMAELALQLDDRRAAGASMFISVKYALRFFLMRKARDFRPQGSTLDTEPPCCGDKRLERLRSASRPAERSRPDAQDRYARKEPWSLSFSVRSSHAEPFEPFEGSTEVSSKAETREDGACSLQRAGTAFRSAPSGTMRRAAPIARDFPSTQAKSSGGFAEAQHPVGREIVELAGLRPFRRQQPHELGRQLPRASAASPGLRRASRRRASGCASGRD